MRCRALAFALALAAATHLADARRADACAPAYPAGAVVNIADESAIIIWDQAASTEHFIRRATFTTTTSDFGFLVPTPSKPELAEAPDSLFLDLEHRIAPRTIYDTAIDGVTVGLLCAAPFWLTARSASSAAPVAQPVRVIEAKRVAGYDAVVLEADSAGALADWLKSHGYASRPALEEWLTPYVAKRWMITAYKIAADRDSKAISTAAVRMSFKTERPFFPYREPSDQREVRLASMTQTGDAARGLPEDRLLRVFFISTSRMEGTIGEGGRAWPGRTVWADAIPADFLKSSLASVSLPFISAAPGAAQDEAHGARAWLTAFEDRSTPRPGTDDILFSTSAIADPVQPPPVKMTVGTKLMIPLDVVALLIGGGVWLAKRARRRREARGDVAAPGPLA